LTPQQRADQLTKEAERRRRERENKELPQPGVPRNVTPPVVKKEAAPVKKVREQRISGLSESQIMERLRAVVSSDDPNKSYTKIKKVGQGASGSVYVARYLNSDPGRKMANGRVIPPSSKVAIKQMDLANQPRKELIVNEILVMKESQHPNIVNFLDSYLVRGSELWVVMEFMEGGALTDVIDHNTLSEDQISCICLEVLHLRES
jgi:serine/threonine-protein kinase CLA4